MIIASLLWKPYDVRFQDLLSQLKTHRTLLQDELQLAHYLATKAAVEVEKDERVKALERRLAATEAQSVAKRALKISEAIQRHQEKEYTSMFSPLHNNPTSPSATSSCENLVISLATLIEPN